MKGYHHVPTGLEYPRGGRSEMDLDPEGQSRGYDLQTVPCHIAGSWSCLTGRENYFQHSRLAGHLGEGFHPQSVGL